MQPHPLERGMLHVEEVQEDERFQDLPEVARTHEPGDRTVAVPSGPADDLARLDVLRPRRRESLVNGSDGRHDECLLR